MSERRQNLTEVSALQYRTVINPRHLQFRGTERCMRCIQYDEERCTIREDLTTCQACYLAQNNENAQALCLFTRTIERIGAANTFGPEELSNEFLPQMSLATVQQLQLGSRVEHASTPHRTPSMLRQYANSGEIVRRDSSDLFLPVRESPGLLSPRGLPTHGSSNISDVQETGASRSFFGATTGSNIESSRSASRRHPKKHYEKKQKSRQKGYQKKHHTRYHTRSQTRSQTRTQSATHARSSRALPLDPRIAVHNTGTSRTQLTPITGNPSERNTVSTRVPVTPGKVLGLGSCYSCRVMKRPVSFTKIKC